MSVPHSNQESFSIGNTSFYKYTAQDSHGTKVTHFAVNGRSVSSSVYRWELKRAIRSEPWFREVKFLLETSKDSRWPEAGTEPLSDQPQT